jgi:hypothetical protein
MPVISEHWEKLSAEQWQHLAEQYLLEITENSGKEYDEENTKWGLVVTEFRFSSSPELQWNFILLALSLADNDEQIGDIAAGQIEHLLGWHGEQFIDLVEQEAKDNPKFATAITGVLQYMMTDDIWVKVQKLQANAEHKLGVACGNEH